MTKISNENIICKNCEHNFSISFYDSINTKLNPELSEKFLNGELNITTCPECGQDSGFIKPVLYHDVKRRIMVWVVPSPPAQLPQKIKEAIIGGLVGKFKSEIAGFTGALGKYYSFDVVFGVDELKESLLSIESGGSEKISRITKNVLGSEIDSDKKVLKHRGNKTKTSDTYKKIYEELYGKESIKESVIQDSDSNSEKGNKKIMNANNLKKIKKSIEVIFLITLVWIVAYWVLDTLADLPYDDPFFESLALAILIGFLYRKITKKK